MVVRRNPNPNLGVDLVENVDPSVLEQFLGGTLEDASSNNTVMSACAIFPRIFMEVLLLSDFEVHFRRAARSSVS